MGSFPENLVYDWLFFNLRIGHMFLSYPRVPFSASLSPILIDDQAQALRWKKYIMNNARAIQPAAAFMETSKVEKGKNNLEKKL